MTTTPGPFATMLDMLGGTCKGCGTDKRLSVHHIWYHERDLRHSDFPRTVEGTRHYHQYLLDLIRSEGRDRFCLLCGKCHYAVSMMCRYHPDKFNRLARLVRKQHKMHEANKP